MIRILVLSFTLLGFGTYLRACPVSGTLKSLDGESMVGYEAGLFISTLEGSASGLVADDFAPAYNPSRAAAQAPEFPALLIIPEVVRIVLMGSGLIFLAAIWLRRENRRLSRFV